MPDQVKSLTPFPFEEDARQAQGQSAAPTASQPSMSWEDRARLIGGTLLRAGGQWGGATAGSALALMLAPETMGASTLALPAAAAAGGAAGGGLGEYLAEKLEPHKPEEGTNWKRVGVGTALGGIPGAALVRTGKPLVSAVAGALAGGAGVAGHRWSGGEPIEQAINPLNWSKGEMLFGPGLGAGASAGLSYLHGGLKAPATEGKPVSSGKPGPTIIKKDTGVRIPTEVVKGSKADIPTPKTPIKPRTVSNTELFGMENEAINAANDAAKVPVKAASKAAKQDIKGLQVAAADTRPSGGTATQPTGTKEVVQYKGAAVADPEHATGVDLGPGTAMPTGPEYEGQSVATQRALAHPENQRIKQTQVQQTRSAGRTEANREAAADLQNIRETQGGTSLSKIKPAEAKAQGVAEEMAAAERRQAAINARKEGKDIVESPVVERVQGVKGAGDIEGTDSMSRRFVEPPPPDEGEAAAGVEGLTGPPQTPQGLRTQFDFEKPITTKSKALKLFDQMGFDRRTHNVKKFGDNDFRIVPNEPPPTPPRPTYDPNSAAGKFQKKVDDILAQVGEPPPPEVPPTAVPPPTTPPSSGPGGAVPSKLAATLKAKTPFEQLSPSDRLMVMNHLQDATNNGFSGDPDVLANKLAESLSYLKDMDSAAASSGLQGNELFKAIRKNGGFNTNIDYKGELNWLKEMFGKNFSKSGLFNNKSGRSMDDMRFVLQADYPEYKDMNKLEDLFQAMRKAATGTQRGSMKDQLANYLGAPQGKKWWTMEPFGEPSPEVTAPPVVEPSDSVPPPSGGDTSFNPDEFEPPAAPTTRPSGSSRSLGPEDPAMAEIADRMAGGPDMPSLGNGTMPVEPPTPPVEPPMTVPEFGQALSTEGSKPLVTPKFPTAPIPSGVTPPEPTTPDMFGGAPPPPEKTGLDSLWGDLVDSGVHPKTMDEADARYEQLYGKPPVEPPPAEPLPVPAEPTPPPTPLSGGAAPTEPVPSGAAPIVEPPPPDGLKARLIAAGNKYGGLQSAKRAGQVVDEDARSQAAQEAQALTDEWLSANRGVAEPDFEGMPDVQSGILRKRLGIKTPKAVPTPEPVTSDHPDVLRGVLDEANDPNTDPIHREMLMRWLNEHGGINPMTMARMGLGGAGAAYGAATGKDSDDRMMRAAMFGGAGALAPGLAAKAAEHMPEMDLASLGKKIPDIQRAFYLSEPNGMAANVLGANVGLNWTTSMERMLGGDFQRGKAFLKQLPSLPGRTKAGMREAGSLLQNSPMNIAEMMPWDREKNPIMKTMLLPAQAITAAHVGLKNAALESGFEDSLAHEFALANEPAEGTGSSMLRAAGKGLQSMKAAKSADGTPNFIGNLTLPFNRTASNVAAATPTRVPGLGIVANMFQKNPETLHALFGQQATGTTVAAGAYTLGHNVSPENAKYVRKWVRNLGGRYGIVASVAFNMGQADQEGKAKGSEEIWKGVMEGLPMATPEVVKDWYDFGMGLKDGKLLFPRSAVPGPLKDIVEKSGVLSRKDPLTQALSPGFKPYKP